MRNQLTTIDIYPVGWLDKIRKAWVQLVVRRDPQEARRYLAQEWYYCRKQARAGNWRAVRMTFNGYLAEPTPFPEGLKRCGSGWTRVRARKSLERHLRKSVTRPSLSNGGAE